MTLQRPCNELVAGSLQDHCRVVAGSLQGVPTNLKYAKTICFFAVFDIELEDDGSATTLQQARCRVVAGSLQGRCRVVARLVLSLKNIKKPLFCLQFFRFFYLLEQPCNTLQ